MKITEYLNFKLFLGMAFTILLISSCASKKNYIYFQDTAEENYNDHFEIKYKKGDLLEIELFSSNPIANVPFTTGSVTSASEDGLSIKKPDYIVDNEGYIKLPIVGKQLALGKSKKIFTEELETLYAKYLDKPLVNVKLLNFKVIVLGDAGSAGVYPAENEIMTLPQLFAISGDVNFTAKRKRIKIIRDEGGVLKTYFVDLTDKNIFQSPVYFLQQNDIVYIEPNRTKMDASLFSPTYAIVFSLSTFFLTTFSILFSK
jgi:polysaccharide export outer membrane protein